MTRPTSPDAPPARVRDGLTVALLLVGLLPIAGLLLLGAWPSWEVGAGTAIALLAGHALVRGS